jgi:hypothetical protein
MSKKASELLDKARPLIKEAGREDLLPDARSKLLGEALPLIVDAVTELAGGSKESGASAQPAKAGDTTSPSGGKDGTDTSGPDVAPVPAPEPSGRPDQRAINRGDPPSRSTGESPEDHDKRWAHKK